ncbi:uncharacterized protein [Hyperolius riggenbachi]|uniref:uncharacterized protein n=1 Tax=Hyperolius riggenbachi TaxID=752182 RepID=UPI0035A38AF3
MKAVLPAVCILCGIISTASSLECIFCNTILSTRESGFEWNEDFRTAKINCMGGISECVVEGSVCASIYAMSLKYDGTSEVFLHKTCLPSKEECGTRESITTPGLKVAYSITCCSEDGCTPQVPVLPADNKTKNGVFCPACYGETSDCETQNSMACTGEEKYCLKYQKMVMMGFQKSVSSGCASEKVCKENRTLGFLTPPRSLETSECFKVSSNTDLKPDGRDEFEITRRCGKSSECSRAGTIRSSTKVIVINTTCCDNNVCQPPFPALPIISDEDNGLICPACFVPNSDRCLGRYNLKCTGEEKRCIHYMRTEKQDISTVTESLYGCTTDTICEAGSSLTLPKGHYYKSVKTDIACNRAATLRSLAHLFFNFSFVVLFVLKANL